MTGFDKTGGGCTAGQSVRSLLFLAVAQIILSSVKLSVLLSEIVWFGVLMERDPPLIIYCMFMMVLSLINNHIHQEYCVYCNCRNMKNV
jgi:hypothetical protein